MATGFGRDTEQSGSPANTPAAKGSNLWAKGGGPKGERAKGAGGGKGAGGAGKAGGGGKAAVKGKTAGKATVGSVVANPKAIAANKWDQAYLKAKVDPATEDVSWSMGQAFGAKVAASGMHQATLTAGGLGGVVTVKATSADKSSSAMGKVTQVKFDAITFSPKELKNDGKTTSAAKVKVVPGGRKTAWEFIGDSYGAKIGATGVIDPGTAKLPDKKFQVELGVKATDTEVKTATSKARVKLWDAKYLKAKEDYDKFVAGGAYNYPNFTKGHNGKFDFSYNPAARSATVDVNVKFSFLSDDKAKGKWTQKDKDSYSKSYMTTVVGQWNKRYTINNSREPQAVWSKLHPVQVQVNVNDMDAGKGTGKLHFRIDVHKKNADFSAGEFANVSGGVTTLYPNHGPPTPAFNPDPGHKDVHAGELARVRAISPSPVYFDSYSTALRPSYNGPLTDLATYVKRINAPKFNITVTGHSSIWGDDADNMKRSQERADAVAGKLRSVGVGGHKLATVAKGESGGGWLPRWRKAVIDFALQPGFQNVQDVQSHEFGHQLGLGDEYEGTLSNHHSLVVKAFGKTYADQVAIRGGEWRSSMMGRGSDLRVYHYVTIWSALCETTLTKAKVPDPKFGYDDWKLNG